MNFKKIKKVVASALVFSSIFLAGTTSVQASESYNTNTRAAIHNARDGQNIYKGTVSVSGQTNYYGSYAVTIPIPAGMSNYKVSVNGDPEGVEDVRSGNNVIIYGLMPGVTYSYMRLTFEDDFRDIDYVYNINPFTVRGGATTTTPTPTPTPVPTPAPVPTPTPVPSNVNSQALSNYLNTVYTNVFNRNIDTQGLEYWSGRLSTGQTTLKDFFKNLLVEAEFMQVAPSTQDKIRALYKGIFQRDPDSEGFNYWVSKYNQELTMHNSQNKALVDVIDEMANGQEFSGILSSLGIY